MAKTTNLTCDRCGKVVEGTKGSVILVLPFDTRRHPKEADFCEECVDQLPTQRVADRRGT